MERVGGGLRGVGRCPGPFHTRGREGSQFSGPTTETDPGLIGALGPVSVKKESQR